MKRYEYKVIEMKNKEKLYKSNAPEFNKMLNQEGAEGWRLVQIYYPLANHTNFTFMNAIFERELDH
jgi:hypothetical protein